MKRMKEVRQIYVYIFCIIIISSGMYAPEKSIDFNFSRAKTLDILSIASIFDKRMDATDDRFETVTDEIRLNFSYGIKDTVSSGISSLKSLSSTAFPPYIPLILWTAFCILLQSRYADIMYVIWFIHNSDGKKGAKQAFLRLSKTK